MSPPPAAARDTTLYLLDISAFIFRAYFAIRAGLSTKHGEPTNAVLGVANMLGKLVDEANPAHMVCVYDSKEGPSFRKELYSEYKANRSKAPDDLVPQFDRIEQLITAMHIPSVRQNGMEADDLIATLTKDWLAKGPHHHVVVVTGDKDLMQLVTDRVAVWDTMAGKHYGPEQVEEKFGIPPTQIRDYLALVGDTSDNVPGVKGIGPKTATDLLKEYGTLEGVLKAAKAGQIPGKKAQTIAASEAEALLSQKLVSLEADLDFELSHAETNYRFQMDDRLADLFRELEFNNLIPRWQEKAGGKAAAIEAPSIKKGSDSVVMPTASIPAEQADFFAQAVVKTEAVPFQAIQNEKDLAKLLGEIERRGEFGVDLETTSLNPRLAELVGVALCPDLARSFYVPVGHRGTDQPQLPAGRVLEMLKPLLENPRVKKIGQNLKYDWSVLQALGLKPDGIGADTMVASYVLDPEGRHNLDHLADKYLGYKTLTFEEVCGKGKDQIGFDLVPVDLATRYSAEDAWVACKLWDTVRPQLQADGLMQIFAEVDMPLVPVLARMEMEGIAIDADWLAKLSRDFEKELKGIEERVGAFTAGPVNLNSTKQLAKLLFEDLKLPTQSKTKTGFSTDASVLEALAPLHEVPRLLLEYREISKLKGTYVDPLPAMRDPRDGRIHGSFHQAVAATGRLSGSDPNLQNIPIRTERGRSIRRAFVASPGNVLLSADYSQIELRILAHMSGDADLSASFQKDEDVHRRTASEIFSVGLEQVDDRQRGIAKAINFGLMYGKSAFGLAQELHIPRKEAADIIERYFKRYAQVKRFLDGQIESAREKGYSTTMLGRRRWLRDIQSRNHAVRANAERMAMNAPIQGTAADLMKLAMIGVDDALRDGGYRSKLIVQVHDEVLLDCPQDEAPAVQKLVSLQMENAMKMSVPLKVNSAVGTNWQEL